MDPRLQFARELEGRDAAVAECLELLARLAADVGSVRRRAAEAAAFLERLPGERAHLDAAAADAEVELGRARGAQEQAAAHARARGDAQAAAGRELAGAEAALRAAGERVERTATRRAALEAEAERTDARAPALAEEAAGVARELEAAPRVSPVAAPGPSLGEVLEWAARAHTAVLVGRGGLESERERIVREANELASSVLGEPLQAGSVALVRRRLEELLV